MSRFLFTCWPFVGHVHNQLGIATALRDGGHEVAVYTGESARPVVEGAGLSVFAFSALDERRAFASIAALEAQGPPSRPNPATVRRTFREWLVETIPDQTADLEPLIEAWRPDAIVTDLSLWAPIVILWEKTGLPVALSSTFMGPLIPGPDAPAWGLGLAPPRSIASRVVSATVTRVTEWLGRGLRHRVDELRAEHGLRPLGVSVNVHSGRLPLYLVGNVPELDYGRRDLPPSVQYVGPCLWHPPQAPEAAAWLDAVPAERPWVHVSEGTLHAGDPFLLSAAVRALADRECEVILTTGGTRDPESLGLGHTGNAHVARWIDHAELLPRCAAVVTTGGAATIIAALRSGVPLVVVPTTWDKPDNARRVLEAGVGVRVSPRRCTPERLRAAVEHVLNDARIRANARAAGARLAAAPGAPRAAELLAALPAQRSAVAVGGVR